MNDGYNKPVLIPNVMWLFASLSEALQETGLGISNLNTGLIGGEKQEKRLCQKAFEIIAKNQHEIVPGDLVRSEWQRIKTGD